MAVLGAEDTLGAQGEEGELGLCGASECEGDPEKGTCREGLRGHTTCLFLRLSTSESFKTELCMAYLKNPCEFYT